MAVYKAAPGDALARHVVSFGVGAAASKQLILPTLSRETTPQHFVRKNQR
jgi:hypothetical protein